MNRNAIASVLVAALVLLAGCSAGTTGAGGEDITTEGTAAATGSTSGSGAGTVNLYVSDERNAIGDFEHLNVTITRVGLQPAGDGTDAAGDDATDDDTADEGDAEEDPADTDANETVTNETAASTATPAEETGGDVEDGAESDGGWVEYEVDNRTIDLTRLQGANATKLSSFDVPNGSYGKVFVYVSEVDGTLKDGSSQRVKLPSGKLQLDSAFTVGDGEEVDFVFDVTAVEAGQSGKYVLKPVISESGTDVEIESVDDGGGDDEGDAADRGDEAGDRPDAEASALNASFVGNVTRGENATLSVTRDGSAVANASVSIDDEVVGTTGADGSITVSVPEDIEKLSVSVTKDEMEGEIEIEFDSEAGAGSERSNGDRSAAA